MFPQPTPLILLLSLIANTTSAFLLSAPLLAVCHTANIDTHYTSMKLVSNTTDHLVTKKMSWRQIYSEKLPLSRVDHSVSGDGVVKWYVALKQPPYGWLSTGCLQSAVGGCCNNESTLMKRYMFFVYLPKPPV
jgi:hypothetical protein